MHSRLESTAENAENAESRAELAGARLTVVKGEFGLEFYDEDVRARVPRDLSAFSALSAEIMRTLQDDVSLTLSLLE